MNQHNFAPPPSQLEVTFLPWRNPGNLKIAIGLIGALVFLFFLSYFSTFILSFMLAIATTALLKPLVHSLENEGVNSFGAVVLAYLVFLLFLVAVVLGIGPFIGKEFHSLLLLSHDFNQTPLSANAQKLITTFSAKLSFLQNSQAQQDIVHYYFHAFSSLLRGASTFGISLFFSIPGAAIFLAALFFLLKDSDYLFKRFIAGMPNRLLEFSCSACENIRRDLSAYFRSLFFVVIINSIIYGIAFKLLGLPFPALLGVFSGLAAMVPLMGSVIGAIPAALIGIYIFNNGAFLFVLAGLFAGVNFIQAVIFKYLLPIPTAKIHNLAVLAAIFIGAIIWGVWGIIFAAPAAVCIVFIGKQILWGVQNFRF